jgi:dynein heavy chain
VHPRAWQGNALLLGVGGSGRQSMTKLATYIAGYQLFQVEIKKGYGVSDWRDDIRRCLLLAGLKDRPTTFLFSDAQIVNETMLEDINNVLNAGDVPNLYGPEDMDAILSACRADCQKKRIQPTKLNIFAQYILRVRRNIHVVLCMSPLGEAFRDRLRMFPSLVNCCTIDWFTEWPAEALRSVAMAALKSQDLELDEHLEAVVLMFQAIHQSVEKKSVEFFEILRRRNYVTPTSYLELLGSFKTLLTFKREEVDTMRRRLQIGLDKLTTTKAQVSVMQEELQILQPQLVVTQAEVAQMMTQIAVDKAAADETRIKVEADEKVANEKAQATKAIADDAQRDLDEAMPALDAALECLKNLKKSDIDEVKSLKTPPYGVKLTMEVCCNMFEVKPIMVNDPSTPGKKVADFWQAAQKNLINDAKTFLDMLTNFDRDNIKDKVIKAVEPYMKDPAFTPKEIEKASKACTAVCMWAQAMYKYHFVAMGVAPKRAALAAASSELAVVMAQLNDAKSRLAAVVSRLAELESAFNTAVAKKDALQAKEEQCKVQLVNADRLIGGLGGEEKRWRETVERLFTTYTNVTGDVLVSAGTISYLGPFTFDFRTTIVEGWQEALVRLRIPHTKGCDIESTLVQPVKLRSWQLAGLPTDSLSTQNGIVMDKARRWPLLIDPQGQGNRFIKGLGKDKNGCVNGMDVVKLSDKNFLRTLENGVRFGKWVLLENIAEELDAALEPILLQQKFKQGGQDMIRLGDNSVPYNDQFRFFMTTKQPNPHYPPEIQVKVSLLNFTITQSGLEEQLLGVVVREEMPELAEKKVQLVISNAEMNKQLYDIESQILYLLSNSQGNILDDTVLIETLAHAKATSETIKGKMAEATETEQMIYEKSEEYRPVANRASLLYFCIADLCNVDPMYQYSLPWFTQLFVRGINNAPPSNELAQRLVNLNDFFTYQVYANICRSLFERHKLLFSFLLTIKILQGASQVDPLEWRFLISGMAPNKKDLPNPDSTWIESNVWSEVCAMSGLPAFREFPVSFTASMRKWKDVFDSVEPQNMAFPPPFDNIQGLHRMCILRCLRRDKMMEVGQMEKSALY